MTKLGGSGNDKGHDNSGTISQSMIDSNQVPRFEANIPVVDKFPREWYDPSEDAEWESYLNDRTRDAEQAPYYDET